MFENRELQTENCKYRFSRSEKATGGMKDERTSPVHTSWIPPRICNSPGSCRHEATGGDGKDDGTVLGLSQYHNGVTSRFCGT